MNKIAIVGLGYVGLPLALQAEVKGFRVVGVDLNKKKLKFLKTKQSPIDDEVANERLKNTDIEFTDDLTILKKVDVAIVCVPTPVKEDKTPDISIVKEAAVNSAQNLKKGSLLVIESTINPGVCDEIIIPAIEAQTNHKIGVTLHLAHCPERINPGDPRWHVGNIDRVLGADSDRALKMAYKFYSKLLDAKIKKMGNLKEAEAVKIVENSFRDINIAFVNELAMSFSKLGINVNNVIEGAATKPFAFMPHYPGIGVGGHCIPVDPYYLIDYAHGKGFEHHFLKLARSINNGMPVYAIDKVEQALIEGGKGDLRGKNITVLGLSYKANVADNRESPANIVIDTLKQRGANISIYDPYFIDESTTTSLSSVLHDKDAIILVTAHDEFKSMTHEDLSEGTVLLDGRNIFSKSKKDFIENGIVYIGLGT